MNTDNKDKLFNSFKNKIKLKAVWTVESRQDLRAFHNTEAEYELSKILSKELFQDLKEKN